MANDNRSETGKKNDTKHCDTTARYRSLTELECDILKKNGNSAQSWDLIKVYDGFHPEFINSCRFFGEILLGATKEGFIDHEGCVLPIGLYNSTFVNCQIGSYAVINNLAYCSNSILGNNVFIHNAGEISNSSSARFGNGAIGEISPDEHYRYIQLINENGGRSVIPFEGMLCTDAFLWAKLRDDTKLMDRFKTITCTTSDTANCRGSIGDGSIVRNVKSIRNTKIGQFTIIDGAEKIDNCTIRSTDTDPTVIGAGVILVDTISGYGNSITTGAQLHSVITGNSVSVSQTSRISHSYIGDNSAIACCEIAHSLILPSHGQHHNNSFLIAAMIGGQSNIAAGATIGSNHNSRINDGEIWASRGFWPGLCTSFKHNSRFASYTMCAKSDYPSELDIPFPFSLILNDSSKNNLLVFPAYWFTNNMYALMRSRLKFGKRDKRIHKDQIIEHDPFAPDTIEEIFSALRILERMAGQFFYKGKDAPVPDDFECEKQGKRIFETESMIPDQFEQSSSSIEKSKRPVIIKSPADAWRMYRDMILWYAVKTIITNQIPGSFNQLSSSKNEQVFKWINCGGQSSMGRIL
jgi:NDP-sugar pyrophosphorylase family protein